MKEYSCGEISGQFLSIDFLSTKLHLVTPARLLDLVHRCIADDYKIIVANHNLHSLCLHHGSSPESSEFRRFYAAAHVTVADGMSVILLAKLKGHRAVNSRFKVSYNDWLPSLLPVAVANSWRIYYLGSTPFVAAEGANRLRVRFPGLQFGAHHGFFDREHQGAENQRVLADIVAFRPHILFVGMGMPNQELWILENWNDLTANVILPAGATLDYVAGVKLMAPRWMGRIGLEWAFRLATEPRRLAHRYLVEPWGLLRTAMTSNSPFDHAQLPSLPPDQME